MADSAGAAGRGIETTAAAAAAVRPPKLAYSADTTVGATEISFSTRMSSSDAAAAASLARFERPLILAQQGALSANKHENQTAADAQIIAAIVANTDMAVRAHVPACALAHMAHAINPVRADATSQYAARFPTPAADSLEASLDSENDAERS
jgi:hypothetical protein